jgi:hypothetical protein
MSNPNIGHVVCPITKKLAVVRADCRGKLYFYSEAGKITPNLITGQAWLKAAFVQWGTPDKPPESIMLRVVVHGAPPIVEYSGIKDSVTPKAAPVPLEKPVTHQGVTVETPRSILSEFMWGGS